MSYTRTLVFVTKFCAPGWGCSPQTRASNRGNYETFIPTYFHSWKPKFHNFRSREWKWRETFTPRNFHSMELSLPQPT